MKRWVDDMVGEIRDELSQRELPETPELIAALLLHRWSEMDAPFVVMGLAELLEPMMQGQDLRRDLARAERGRD